MGLESLLDRLEREAVTPVTPTHLRGVTAKPALCLAVTPVTPVTPKNINGRINERKFPAVWLCQVGGKELTAIDPYHVPDDEMVKGFRERFGWRFQYAQRIR